MSLFLRLPQPTLTPHSTQNRGTAIKDVPNKRRRRRPGNRSPTPSSPPQRNPDDIQRIELDGEYRFKHRRRDELSGLQDRVEHGLVSSPAGTGRREETDILSGSVCSAVHCFAKALASEKFIVVPAHPGWVVTDMVRLSSALLSFFADPLVFALRSRLRSRLASAHRAAQTRTSNRRNQSRECSK